MGRSKKPFTGLGAMKYVAQRSKPKLPDDAARGSIDVKLTVV